jgi:membrane-associated phospholipid phosphatase
MDRQMDLYNSIGYKRKMLRTICRLGLVTALLAGILATALKPGPVTAANPVLIEPQAGTWSTWVLENGSQLRPAAPPGKLETKAEIQELKVLAEQRDQNALDRIAYWNTGAPAYRWNEMAIEEALFANLNSMMAGRALALIHAAIYDATVAAWDAKFTYNRLRPSQIDRRLTTVILNPPSPSYPSEHAVTAGAASELLAYLFPTHADFFRSKAEEAGEAFLLAGVNYRSDVEAGLEMGRQVAALVIERAMSDGSDAQWDGTMPVGPGYWTGQNPVLPIAGTWQTWVLESGNEYRPGPPFAYDSPERTSEMDELRNFQRTPKTNAHALFWEYGAGGTRNYAYWNEQLSRKLLEYRLDDNAPRTARAFALMHIAYYDSMVACWDAKYTYWTLRPFQLDPAFQTLFTTPNHPSYPSAHSCLSGAAAGMLGYLFPREAQGYQALVEVIGESRLWAGIHFRSDVTTGLALGHSVASKVIEHAQNDGSE